MQYPKDFVDRVKEEFPGYERLHNMLDKGDERVGDLIAGEMDLGLTSEKIVSLIDEGKVEEIRKFAKRSVRRQKLCKEFIEIARPQGFFSEEGVKD